MKTRRAIVMTLTTLVGAAAIAGNCWLTSNGETCAQSGWGCNTGHNCRFTADICCDRDRNSGYDEGYASASNVGCKGPAVWDDDQGTSHSGTASTSTGGNCYEGKGACPAPA